MFHDPEVYEDPERFNPDRYMESEFGTKKARTNDIGRRNNLAFGSGRVSMHVLTSEYQLTGTHHRSVYVLDPTWVATRR